MIPQPRPLVGDSALAAVAPPLGAPEGAAGAGGGPLRVLIVDGDTLAAHEVRQFLRRHDVAAAHAASPGEARAASQAQRPDVVVTDSRFREPLPPTYLADLLASWPSAALIVACASADARVVGRLYEAGADVVLPKPYAADELLVRLRALARRRALWSAPARDATAARAPAPGVPVGLAPGLDATSAAVVQLGDVEVDLDRGAVRAPGRRAGRLTRNEMRMLRVMAARMGEAVSRPALLREVWDAPEAVSTDSPTRRVDTAVAALRRKVEAAPAAPRHLLTVPGVGYRLLGTRVDPAGSRSTLW